MSDIILTTFNARYLHAAVGLRYLQANLRELADRVALQEYTITDHPLETAEKILAVNPKIVGIGVYIWNGIEVQRLVTVLKKVAPQVILVLGGPEVSHLPLRLDFADADYIVQGEGEDAFYQLCRSILAGNRPAVRVIKAEAVDISSLVMPYHLYTPEDFANRVTYVEASRGCPFSCEFCLSSLDRSVRYFAVDSFLEQLQLLWQQGARRIKFIDRTFNLNLEIVERILDFFLGRQPPYHVHFEVVPDNFPARLKEKLKRFPPGVLQFEVGIQTLDPDTAARISRPLNFARIKENLIFLETETNIHLHIDLIIGLPGEPIASFGANLNSLMKFARAEIQLGVLKKLSGTRISRHDRQYGMVYADQPPYEILQNDLIPFEEMQTMKRFARFWDLVYNSGNFNKSVSLLWEAADVYSGFRDFSQWLYQATGATWQISLNRLATLLFTYLTENKGMDSTLTANSLAEDLLSVRGRSLPDTLREHATYQPVQSRIPPKVLGKRQLKHLKDGDMGAGGS